MTTVIGVDASLTATGVAIISPDTAPFADPDPDAPMRAELGTFGSRPTTDTIRDRSRRHHHLAREVCDLAGIGTADLVVIEAPSYGSRDGHAWDRAHVWWMIVDHALTHSVPVISVPPARVKKFATGKGNADKTTVAIAVARLWPDVMPANDNEADALALASIGTALLDVAPFPLLQRHRDVLKDIPQAWKDQL